MRFAFRAGYGVLLSFSFFSAASETRVFTPSVTFEDSSDGIIELVADEYIFPALYSSVTQSFRPVSIPFQVVSISGNELDYQLTLITSTHQCEGVAGEADIDVDVDVKLNGDAWGTDGLGFRGVLDAHTINLSYGVVPQKELAQSCLGTLRIQAEVVSI